MSKATEDISSTFSCNIEMQPDFLSPRHYVNKSISDDLSVNTQIWYSLSNESSPPSYLADHVHYSRKIGIEGFNLWVLDPVSDLVLPFEISEPLWNIILNLKPEKKIQEQLHPRMLRKLIDAKVLVDNKNVETERLEWLSMIERASEDYEKGYGILRKLFHPYHLSSLRRHYRTLIRIGKANLGDRQTKHRYVMHNEIITTFYHQLYTPLISKVTRCAVKPSYVYFSSYQKGASLPIHKDRPQCKHSVSILIDYSPEPSLESNWPICLETINQQVLVHQALGDGLLYNGTELPHFRNEIPNNCTSTSIFMHYVDVDFEDSLN